MKKLLILIFSLSLLSFTPADTKINTEQNATVIICTGQYATKYHSKMCSGMNACKGEVKKITEAEAKKQGRTKCGICYK